MAGSRNSTRYSHRDMHGVDITILASIRNHVESVCKDSNTTVSRMSMISHVLGDLPRVSMHSIDSTRNYLTQAGYLTPSEKRGRYVMIKSIPKGLKMTELISEAYPDRKAG